MKMIYANIDEMMQPAVLALLKKLDVHDYEIFKRVTGEAPGGQRFMDNSIWPGYHICLLIPFRDDEKARIILQQFKEMNKTAHHSFEKVACCVWKIDEYFYE
mgnify:CR=1 FL=1